MSENNRLGHNIPVEMEGGVNIPLDYSRVLGNERLSLMAKV